MRPEVAFVVPARNKAPYVEQTVNQILVQDYSPMQLVFSDQGSTDGTYEKIQEAVQRYNGPNEVRVLQCPHTEHEGMPGLNAHYNWLHEEVDAKLLIFSSADDRPHPNRARNTVELWKEYEPSYIASKQINTDESFNTLGETSIHLSGFLDLQDMVIQKRTGAMSSCWEHDLFAKHGPLPEMAIQDLVVPMWGALEKGVYYTAKKLQNHVHIADASKNTGLEGVMRAAESVDEQERIKELICYHLLANLFIIVLKLQEYADHPVLKDAVQATLQDLHSQILAQSLTWVQIRDWLTLNRVPPKAFDVGEVQ